MVAHTDSRFAPGQLSSFVRAYQRIRPLTIGGLWAIPIILRVVMVENLRRLAILILLSQIGRRFAGECVDQVEQFAAQIDKSYPPLAALVLSAAPLHQAYAVRIIQRLHEPHPGAIPSLDFLNGWLPEQGNTLDEVVQREHGDPDQSLRLQGQILYDARGHVRGATSYATRWLDMVYRSRGMLLPKRLGMDAGFAVLCRSVILRSLYSERGAVTRCGISMRTPVIRSRWRIPPGWRTVLPSWIWTEYRKPWETRSRSCMIGRSIGCGRFPGKKKRSSEMRFRTWMPPRL